MIIYIHLQLFVLSIFYAKAFGSLNELSSSTDDDFYVNNSNDGVRTVVEGEENVTLICPVSNSEEIEFEWTLNGRVVENTTRRFQIESNLIIRKIVKNIDSGAFECIGTNKSTGVTIRSPIITLNIPWLSKYSSVKLGVPATMKNVEKGMEVILECSLEGSLEIHFEWKRNGEELDTSDGRIVVRGKWLHIMSVTSDDNGSYNCRGKSDVGETEPDMKLDLIVNDERVPDIKILPKNGIVDKNKEVLFNCSYENNESTQWYFLNKGPLQNSSKYTIYENGSLKIDNVEESDEGMYKCLNYFTFYPDSHKVPQIYSATLTLTKLEELSFESIYPPLIASSEPILALGLGQNVEIFCKIPKGVPLARQWWTSPSGSLLNSHSNTQHSFIRDSSWLIIKKISKEDEGSYTCHAGNSLGSTQIKFKIIITSPPLVLQHPNSQIVDEGDGVEFFCDFEATNLVSQIQWYHNAEKISKDLNSLVKISNNGTNKTWLKLNSVLLSDSGTYTCEINSPPHPPVKSTPAQLIVTESLKFVSIPMDRKLELGSPYKIHCKAKGSPPPSVKWMKENGYGFESNWPSHVQDEKGTLVFAQVKKSDSGKYVCIATSTQGAINSSMQIDVIVFPRFTKVPQNPTEGVEGESVLMSCEAEGDPAPTIRWDKNSNRSGLDHKRFKVLENGTLFITHVVREDHGNRFGCTAGNSGGFKREEIKLLVRGLSNGEYFSESLDSTGVMTRTVSITLSVAAGYMILVIGLMLWCRYRQLKRKQAYLAEITKEIGDSELKETKIVNGSGAVLVPNGHNLVKTESCRESIKSDNETAKSTNSSTTGGRVASGTASVTSHRSHLSQQSKKSISTNYDLISAPRDDLQFVMLLGNGEFGEIFLSKAKKDNSEILVLVKALQTREESALFEFKREIDMYYKLDHENVCKLVRLCREMDPHYMIMEYSDWGDLKQFLLATRSDHPRTPKPPPLTTSQIIHVVNQISLGMEHLSNHRFVHKDLATRNCLISTGLRIQISSPRISVDTYASEYYKYKNKVVPIRWLPHEALVEDDFSTKTDVWAFGCTIWEIINQAEMPFKNLSDSKIIELIERKELRWSSDELSENIPLSLKKILNCCWENCPRNRPSFSSILVSLAQIDKEEL